MTLEFTTSYLQDSADLFRHYKRLAERAMAQVPDEALFAAPDAESNSIAIIAKHLAGNPQSRWTDFLTTDGEKPHRNRDSEFEAPPATRAELMEQWEPAWKCLFDSLSQSATPTFPEKCSSAAKPTRSRRPLTGSSLTVRITWARSSISPSFSPPAIGRRSQFHAANPPNSTPKWPRAGSRSDNCSPLAEPQQRGKARWLFIQFRTVLV